MIAIQPKSRQILGTNQQAYQALKASMSLNLRRQLLIAVCDNVVLQNHLAAQLENDLAEQIWSTPSLDSEASKTTSLALERVIFDPEDAHLPRQVAHWARELTVIKGLGVEDLGEESLPQLQVLGIEQMTRQPAIVQNHFLRSLEQIESLLPRLNTSLLVWVPWPWLRTIQTSSPTFWKWRSAVFEFVSDPTPTLLPSESPDQNSLQADRFAEESDSYSADSRTSRPISADVAAADPIPADSEYSTTRRDRSSAYSYPAITIPAVVSLYGETDDGETDDGETYDSETTDDNQPALDALATWEAPDAEAVPASVPKQTNVAGTEANRLEVSRSKDTDIELSALFDNGLPEADVANGNGLLAATASAFEARTEPQKADSRKASDQRAQAAAAEQIPGQELDKQTAERERAEREKAERDRIEAQRSEVLSQLAALRLHKGQSKAAQQSETQPSDLAAYHTQASTSDSSEISSSDSAFSLDSSFPSEDTFSLDSSFLSAIPNRSAVDDYFEIGRNYRQRIEAGERGLDLIEPAIAAYEGGLRSLKGPHPDWASGLNDLGTLYWLKAQQLGDQQQIIDCMKHSVELYEEALAKTDPTIEPSMAYQLHSNLGAVHSMLAMHSEPVFHFKQAAESYLNALSLCALATDPEEFATLQNSLGSVYWKLSHYEQERVQIELTLRQAITAYNQSLLGYSPDQRPLDYAAVQNNLGITYWSLAKHTESIRAIKNAIAAYRDALNYRTPETDPATCAITYNNLALAYWDLSKDKTVDREHKLRYQRNAVTAFEAALQTAQSVGSLNKADSAAIYHCLGDVHAQMVENAPSLTEVAESLQRSLYSYVQAIDGMPTESPVFEARISAIIANLRSQKEQLGLSSQRAALNRVPSSLISRVMQAL